MRRLLGRTDLDSTLFQRTQLQHFEGPVQPTRLLSAATAEAARYRHSIARRAVLAAAFTVAALTAACGSDSATGPSKTQVAGTYPMATVRGLSVPRTFTDPAG